MYATARAISSIGSSLQSISVFETVSGTVRVITHHKIAGTPLQERELM